MPQIRATAACRIQACAEASFCKRNLQTFCAAREGFGDVGRVTACEEPFQLYERVLVFSTCIWRPESELGGLFYWSGDCF